MAENEHFRLLERRTVYAGEKGEPTEMGAFKTLCVQTRIIDAGNEGTICLEHSATREDGGFKALGTSVNLTATGATANDVQDITSFLRYVRFATSSAVTGSPIVSIDVIAKEH